MNYQMTEHFIVRHIYLLQKISNEGIIGIKNDFIDEVFFLDKDNIQKLENHMRKEGEGNACYYPYFDRDM